MKPWTLASLAVVALDITGCAVGPPYRQPQSPTPEQWSMAGARGTIEASVKDDSWWTTFQDPELVSLIGRAVLANEDLQLAAARVDEARAGAGLTRSALAPQVAADVSATRTRQRVFSVSKSDAGQTAVTIAPVELNTLEGRFDASWELDVFGRVRRQLAAAGAEIAASDEDRRDVLVTVMGDVARFYAELRGAQRRIDIARENVRTAQDATALTEVRRRAGLVTDLDVARAQAQVESTQAAIPPLEVAEAAATHRLSVLVGQPPAELRTELGRVAPLPSVPPDVPVGWPSELLRRRPDIRRAEAQLMAATARVGMAKADYFPRFTLFGTAGRQATELHEFRLQLGNVFSVGPAVSIPIFSGGRIRSNVAVQEARVRESLAIYQSTVLRSFEETENALVSFVREQDRRDRVDAQVKQNQLALDLATAQYTAGLADFLSVLDAERTVAVSQDLLAQSQTAIMIDLVALYKALGGRWMTLKVDPDAHKPSMSF
jgi:multidrug efflux system outer membrane protein